MWSQTLNNKVKLTIFLPNRLFTRDFFKRMGGINDPVSQGKVKSKSKPPRNMKTIGKTRTACLTSKTYVEVCNEEPQNFTILVSVSFVNSKGKTKLKYCKILKKIFRTKTEFLKKVYEVRAKLNSEKLELVQITQNKQLLLHHNQFFAVHRRNLTLTLVSII